MTEKEFVQQAAIKLAAALITAKGKNELNKDCIVDDAARMAIGLAAALIENWDEDIFPEYDND